MRWFAAAIAVALLVAVPGTSAHGALTINEFDTFAISDFEGQEDSFAWEGFEIWNVYVGDGHMAQNGSHGVYFKANFAGDGSARPTESEVWEILIAFTVGNETFQRTIAHHGEEVTSDFEQLDWQIADGNVFQIHAWVPIGAWEGRSVTDLVVLSSVDGEPRDIAPGGVYDPATGQEVPVEAPSSGVFPAMGEGRIVEEVPLTGPDKFLNVTVTPGQDGWFDVTAQNPLDAQGQHFMFQADAQPGWLLEGAPNAVSLEGGASTSFRLRFVPDENQTVIEPMPFHLLTDIGGRQTFYASADEAGVQVVDDPELASTMTREPVVEEASALPLAWMAIAALVAMVRRRSDGQA